MEAEEVPFTIDEVDDESEPAERVSIAHQELSSLEQYGQDLLAVLIKKV